MADKIQQRRDTAARWAQFNPVLLEGEVGYVTDNVNQYKIGDGQRAWKDLPLRGYTGTISQDFGDDIEAVISQKAITDFTDNNIYIAQEENVGKIQINLINSQNEEWQIIFPKSSLKFYRNRGTGSSNEIGIKSMQFANAEEKDRTFQFNSLKQLILDTSDWMFKLVSYDKKLTQNEVRAFGAREHRDEICPGGILVPCLFYNRSVEQAKRLADLEEKTPPKGGYLRTLFEAAGAVYNDRLDKYTFNDLELSKEQMAEVYSVIPRTYRASKIQRDNVFNFGGAFAEYNGVTFRPIIPSNGIGAQVGAKGYLDIEMMYAGCDQCVNVKIFISSQGYQTLYNINFAFMRCLKLKKIIDVLDMDGCMSANGVFTKDEALQNVKMKNLGLNISFADSPELTVTDDGQSTLAYLIKNKNNATPIEVTLHASAFAKVSQSLKDKAKAAQVSIISA